jgi:adenine-specific DNA-methyltransferase
MPTLNWIGKDKVINHHMDVPFKVLEHSYGFENGLQTDQETNSGNKIIHGDNLEALKALLPEYEGRIKCIYIDPPYNTGNESWVYNDNVNDPKIKKWLGQVVGKEAEDLTRHDKWLCMMYPRLKLLHKLLSDDGVIFISIDDNEMTHLKLIMNEIFGEKNFLGDFVISSSPSGIDYGPIGKTHDYAIFYSKNYNSIVTFQLKEEDKKFKYKDNKGEFNLYPLYNGNVAFNPKTRPNLYYPFYLNPKKIIDEYFFEIGLEKKDDWIEVYPVVSQKEGIPRVWRWGKAKASGELNKEIIGYRTSSGEYRIVQKTRLDTKVIRSLQIDTEVSSRKGTAEVQQIFGDKRFSFPKPVELIKRFLSAGADKNAIILDSFAGSGTSAHAVMSLNNQDGGNRKFILIELGDYANEITAERIKRVINGYGEESKMVEGTGGSFDFYELGQPMFLEDGNLNELVGVEKIRQYVYYTETKTPLTPTKLKDNKHFLGKHNDTAYYFHYEQDEVTTLDHAFLATMKTKAEQYVIYADNCLLTKDFMTKHHIIFKKIPRDITKF